MLLNTLHTSKMLGTISFRFSRIDHNWYRVHNLNHSFLWTEPLFKSQFTCILSKCCDSFQWNGLTGEQMFFAMDQKLPMLLIIQLLFYLLYNVVWIKQDLKKDKKNTVTLNNFSLHQLNAPSNNCCIYRNYTCSTI